MSKALVIKNANFMHHSFDHINIVEPVYCTGISLSQSTMSFTQIEAMSTLTATVTPANTTEEVIFESSDRDVIALGRASDTAAYVYAVGIGTATITAYCGSYSASCTVTVIHTFNANDFFKLDGSVTSDQTDLSSDPVKDFAGVATFEKGRLYADDENAHLLTYPAYSGNLDSMFDTVYPFLLPPNASKISITAPSAFTGFRIVLLDATNQMTYTTGHFSSNGARAKAKYYSSVPFEYTLPENHGANGFVFGMWTSSAEASTVTGDVIVTIT